MIAKVLYICYDGLMEPLGQSQVLQYLRLLTKQHIVTLITYEKPAEHSDKSRFTALRAVVESSGFCAGPPVETCVSANFRRFYETLIVQNYKSNICE